MSDSQIEALDLAEKALVKSRQRFTHYPSCGYDSSGDLGLCSCGHFEWGRLVDAALLNLREEFRR